jgi:phosphatidylglycerol---prolipoprotein diacylglyceryl transferase
MPAPYHNLLSAIFYVFGYGTGIGAFAYIAKRRRLFTSGVWNVAWAGLLGGLVGANLAQWIASLLTPSAYPMGKTVIGGIIGGYLAVFLYKKHIGLKRPLGDLFAFALCAGEAVGRFGCYFGGCCYGKPFAGPWAIFQHDALRHPTQIYLSIAALITLCVLFWLEKKQKLPENAIFYIQGVFFGSFRLAIEFFRDGTTSLFLALNIAQWTSIIFIVYFSIALIKLLRRQSILYINQ